MDRIAREDRRFRPDRAKSNVIVAARTSSATTLKASGAQAAAFRARRRVVMHFRSSCKGSPALKVTSFSYSIGDLIPNSKWDDYGLWP